MAGPCESGCPALDYRSDNITNVANVTNVVQVLLHNNSETTSATTDVLAMHSGIHHHYWTKFSPPPHEIHITIGFAMATIGVLAVAGNTFVIFVFLRFRSLRTPGNLLMINLAVSDLLMAVTGFPLYSISSFYGRWVLPDAVCLFYGACGATFGLLSINSLAAIAVDRYLVIAHSYAVTKRTNRRQAIVMIVLSWINSLCWAIPPLLGWNRYLLEGFGTTCTFDYLSRTKSDRLFVMLMFCCGFCLPLLLIIGSYAYIYSVVHRHERMFRNMSQNLNARIMHGGKEATQRTEMKTARTVILAVLFYCISWVPYATIALIGIYGNYQLLTPLVTAVPGILAKMSTIYNPLLYTFSHPRFHKKVMLLLFKRSMVLDKNTSNMDHMGGGKSQCHTQCLPKVNGSEPQAVSTLSSTSSWSGDTLPGDQRNAFHLRDASDHTDTISLASTARLSNQASFSSKSRQPRFMQKGKKDQNRSGRRGKDSANNSIEERHTFLKQKEGKESKPKKFLKDLPVKPPVETVV
uniref:Rhabdomeric opsin 5 n=1 Tax=Platynereis dumerilii TaxID=6359 RepID=A0A0K0YBF4_PLADU|nr:rhabdomeric opsin 5 [Platynereis dumerilii]